MILDNCTYVTICLVLVILKTFNSFTVCGGSCLLLIGIIVAKMQTGLSILIFRKLSSSSGKIHFEQQLLYRKLCAWFKILHLSHWKFLFSILSGFSNSGDRSKWNVVMWWCEQVNYPICSTGSSPLPWPTSTSNIIHLHSPTSQLKAHIVCHYFFLRQL